MILTLCVTFENLLLCYTSAASLLVLAPWVTREIWRPIRIFSVVFVCVEKESIITRRHQGWHHSHGKKKNKREKKSLFSTLSGVRVPRPSSTHPSHCLGGTYTLVYVCDTCVPWSLALLKTVIVTL